MSERGIPQDVLFLACTRPAMWAGVPHEAAVLNGMLTMILFIIMKNPFYLLIGVALHYVARRLISYDYNMFGTAALWLNTKGRALNVSRWGGSSVSPLPPRRARRVSEVRVHV